MLDLVFEPALRVFKGLLDALAASVVFPAMIGAADAVVLGETVVKRCAAMRAAFGDEAIAAPSIAVEQ